MRLGLQKKSVFSLSQVSFWLLILSLTFLFYLSLSQVAISKGKVRVVATLRWIGYVAKRIGGDRVKVRSLVNPKIDPHRLIPRPSYVSLLRRADLLVYNGLFLESGYLPKLVEKARNPRIMPGTSGDLDCSKFIPLVLERVANPESVLQTADLHPFGNPHYQYYPEDVIAVAKAIYLRLSELDPSGRDYYRSNYRSFSEELRAKEKVWKEKLKPLEGKSFIEYHKSFEYLAKFSGFKIIGTLEPVPGVPPSPSHVMEIVKLAREKKPLAVLTNVYYETRTPERVKELTGVPYLVLPHDLGSMPDTDTYEDMMDLVVEKLTSLIPRSEEKRGDER